ncbi:venom serine protease-like [Episyrphus balteatus]|uniref:venom serine protease-like n=1 Tax=Episyrphus balteatus TaxID=286459 RepID=UPI002485F830|nr:venom serine protease-like [Episyrphus balteatus]
MILCLGIILLFKILVICNGLFEGCNHRYSLQPDTVAYVESPFYPLKYPSGSSCKYSFVAPLDYEIYAECSMAIDKNPNACSTEYFYFSRDGDENLIGAEQFCGIGNLTETTLFTRLVIAYVSGDATNSGVGGSFRCKLSTRPQACDCGWSQNTRIVGGIQTAIGEFPSMVALYNKPTGSIYCGGSIISHRIVLTVTHCVRLFPKPAESIIVVGDHDLSSSTESKYAATYEIVSFIEHPNYNATNNLNDISIIVTRGNIEWSSGVGPVCLPLDQLNNPFDYTKVDVVGWGTTSFAGPKSNTLQKASVNILPNSVCQNIYPNLQSTQVCTFFQNRDACQFDSGGPAIHKGSARQFLLGSISYGFECGSGPGVNTRITSYLPWIRRFPVGKLCPKPYN